MEIEVQQVMPFRSRHIEQRVLFRRAPRIGEDTVDPPIAAGDQRHLAGAIEKLCRHLFLQTCLLACPSRAAVTSLRRIALAITNALTVCGTG